MSKYNTKYKLNYNMIRFEEESKKFKKLWEREAFGNKLLL